MPFGPLVVSCLCWSLQDQGCPLSLCASGSAWGPSNGDGTHYLSWPAVSQSCSTKHLLSTSRVLTRKSTPRTHRGASGLLLSSQPGLPAQTCPRMYPSQTPTPLAAGLPSPWLSNPIHTQEPISSKRSVLTPSLWGSQSLQHSHTLTVSANSRHLAFF